MVEYLMFENLWGTSVYKKISWNYTGEKFLLKLLAPPSFKKNVWSIQL